MLHRQKGPKLSMALIQETPFGAPPIAAPVSVPDGAPLSNLILALLDDAKAEETVTIDLRDKSAIADTMIVTQGRSNRHVGAIAERIIHGLKDGGHGRAGVEGLSTCDWVVLDAGDVIVHVFRPEVRTFYNLEKMWSSDRPVEHLAV
jgi:ribosome-associated protein